MLMSSQAANSLQFDHHLAQQQSHLHQNHHRHVSNASSISSLGSNQSHYDHTQFSAPAPVSSAANTNYAVPVSYTGSVSADAAFGGVPVSADAFHQYPPQHQRSSSTSSSSSPYTESTSVSECDSPDGLGAGPNAGGRKASQVQMMRRARTHASPYTLRSDQLSWNGPDPSATGGGMPSNVMRSHSVASDAPSSTEEEIAQLLRSQSRESSVSDWNINSHSTQQISGPQHHQTGLGSAGAFMDPYAAVANVHGHAGAFGTTPVSITNTSSNGIGGMMPAGMVGVGGMINTSLVGGMGAQMGRMSLDSTETYEALAHHIRTAVTTSASDRARQAFVQAWLNSSYISYTDGNVSRQGLYGSYLRICQQYDIKPINSASFGKSVRQSFPNIKTRRLGVRGNSKYHYCGIRPATAKEAEILMNLSRSEKPEPIQGGHTPSSADDDIDSDDSPSRRPGMPADSNVDDNYHGLMSLEGGASQPQTPRTARPSFRQSMPLPNLEEALNQPMAHDLDHQNARDFWAMYTEHSKSLLESVKNYRFDQFELTLRTFWTSLDSTQRACVTHSVMMSLVYRADAVVYDEILDYLHAQTRNQMPQQAFGSLRQLAQNMEQVIIAALDNFASAFVGPKIELAARFGHLVVRNLGICQLAQALSGIFSNPANLKDMAEAWDGIDFEAVRNQAALVTNCQHEILGACFDDFRVILNNPNASIEHFISFVESTYERCLQPTGDGERGLSPRSLLVRWCFVSSQLIRDLTLRSASSFGSFQIVNLFFDEWLGLKVLRKVALHVAAVAASVESTPCTQSQQIGPESAAMYSNDSFSQPSDFPSFNTEGLNPNKLVTDSLNAGGITSTVANSESEVTNVGDGFLFSSNTSQTFSISPSQAQTQSDDQTVIFNSGLDSAASYYETSNGALGSENSDSQSAKHQDRLADMGSRASSNGLGSHDDLNSTDVNGSSNSFDDTAFKELMDVSGFSMSIKNSVPDPSNQNGHSHTSPTDTLCQPTASS